MRVRVRVRAELVTAPGSDQAWEVPGQPRVWGWAERPARQRLALILRTCVPLSATVSLCAQGSKAIRVTAATTVSMKITTISIPLLISTTSLTKSGFIRSSRRIPVSSRAEFPNGTTVGRIVRLLLQCLNATEPVICDGVSCSPK